MTTTVTLAKPLPARHYLTGAMATIRPGVAMRATDPRDVGNVLAVVIWLSDGEKYIASALAFRNAR